MLTMMLTTIRRDASVDVDDNDDDNDDDVTCNVQLKSGDMVDG